MPAKAPLRLQVSNRADFFLPVGVLYLLVFLAVLISPYPVMLSALSVAVFAAAWPFPILDFSKANNKVKLTLVIFPDGRVHLESGEMRSIAGYLDGQQWSTRHLAVLRINDGGRCRNLLILSRQQHDANAFRRLSVWLRQDLCNNAGYGI